MAEITLGMGTSHSPMLSTPPEALAGLGDLDRGRLAEFAGKARENAAWIARELAPAVTRRREHDFDVAHVRVQPRHGPFGHAWNFVHQRIMGERVVPIVPVMLNTYYPPTQPTPRRCYQLGRAIRQAVEAWPWGKRVGIVASGGLSHFFVAEELDRPAPPIPAQKDAHPL